jgi:hypothetical protein
MLVVLNFICMVCIKFSPSHLYRWAKGEALHSHRNFYYVELSKFFLMGQSKWLIANKTKKKKELRNHLGFNRINKV